LAQISQRPAGLGYRLRGGIRVAFRVLRLDGNGWVEQEKGGDAILGTRGFVTVPPMLLARADEVIE
jgi:hypothetical protein